MTVLYSWSEWLKPGRDKFFIKLLCLPHSNVIKLAVVPLKSGVQEECK